MFINVVLFLTVVFYSMIVSQSFMYILTLNDLTHKLDGPGYVFARKIIDRNMRKKFSIVVYGTLILNLLLVVLQLDRSTELLFITSSGALVALVTDNILTVKGNLPLNAIINNWSPENVPDNWKEIRLKWLHIYQQRQVVNIIGFLSLVAGAVFR